MTVLCTASAAADTIGSGDGHSGPLTVTGQVVVNAYSGLGSDAGTGDTRLLPTSPGTFSPGDVVMVLQVGGVPDVDAGDPQDVDLTPLRTGAWELHRVLSVNGSALMLDSPITAGFEAATSQMVKLPEYTSVDITDGGRLTAKPWDGVTGGVTALLVTGSITVNGSLDADGAGLRGGLTMQGQTIGSCTGLSEPIPTGAYRGEGLAFGSNGGTGRGNVANGGGGGVCDGSGGAGGALIGRGGKGGFSLDNRDVGGLGGARLIIPPERLVLGGGGGAGQSDSANDNAGGSGGGIVFLRAGALAGTGVVSASGADGQTGFNDGKGGGGAGGTLWLELRGVAVCGLLAARGGNGGSVTTGGDPGGGGGGGRITVMAGVLPMTATEIHSGVAGTDTSLTNRGAEPGDAGDGTNSGSMIFFVVDAGIDAGAAMDAGTSGGDAGTSGGDAGTTDMDAGSSADAGAPDHAKPWRLNVACSAAPADLSGLLLLALLGLGRHRAR
jgi:hypothetical protein